MNTNWIVACGILLGVVAVCHGENFEKKLMSHLMSLYDDIDRITRPVEDSKDTIDLKAGLMLLRVKDFDDDKDVITVHAYNMLVWKDAELKWDPAKFGGLADIRIPAEKVWTPDFMLYNGLTDEKEMRDHLVLAYSDGTVLWVPQLEWSIPCEPSGRDAYNCTFVFGSWTRHLRQLDVHFYEDKAEVDLSFLLPNPAWPITASTAWREAKEYDCCPGEVYPTVKFSVTIKKGCEGQDGTCGGN